MIMAKKKSTEKKPKVNKELGEFDIRINTFGEIVSDFNMDSINDFLNRHVDDKKLRHRDDLKEGLRNPADKGNEQEDEE